MASNGFKKPTDIIRQQTEFGMREVGITHPDNTAHVRLLNNGDVHIVVKEGLAIIMSAAQNAILLVADKVKFLTKEDEGLVWNHQAFNPKANSFTEPALLTISDSTGSMFDDLDDFLED